MEILSKSNILQSEDLKGRAERVADFESENGAIKMMAGKFAKSMEDGINCFIEGVRKITGAQFACVEIAGPKEIYSDGEIPRSGSESLKFAIAITSEETVSFGVSKSSGQIFDNEDNRVFKSLAEIAAAFIHNHLSVKIERDNLERVFNSTPSASAIWRGEDLVFDKVNDAYQSLFPDLELEGKPFEEALPPRIVRDYPELFRNILRTGEAFSIQEQYTPVQEEPGGPLIDHYYNVNFVQLKNRDGSAYGIYQHTVDITKQVEARKRGESESSKLEAIFNDSPAALAMFRGREAVFEKINYPWTQLAGPREYIGRTNREVYPELIDSGLNEAIEHVFDTGEPYRGKERELEIDIGDGLKEIRYYDFTFVRVLDGEGKPYGVFCHAHNVSENKKFNELLKSALRSRDVFMSIASHELNTPLTSLKLQTQFRKKILEKNEKEILSHEAMKNFLDSNLAQIDRLSLLVNDMLDVGRINAGLFTVNKFKVNLTELLKETAARFEAHFEYAQTKLITNLENNVEVEIDPLRIDQVVTNFLTNAIKYASKGNVTITLKKNKNFAVVSVKDEGPGVAPENTARIFKRFERATSEMNISGLGLGLFISKQIVELHEGVIGVDGPAIGGAEFYFKIPL